MFFEPKLRDYASPSQKEKLAQALFRGLLALLAGMVGFLLIGFFVVHVAYALFDYFYLSQMPSSRMGQGITGSLFGLFVCLPLGVIIGAIGGYFMGLFVSRSMAPKPDPWLANHQEESDETGGKQEYS